MTAPITTYSTIEGNIQFYEDNKGKLSAKVDGIEKKYTVEFPERLPKNQFYFSEADKVKALLANRSYFPEINKLDQKVQFKVPAIAHSTWHRLGEVELPLVDKWNSVWTFLKNGKVAHAFVNTVTKVDEKGNIHGIYSFNTKKVCSISEYQGKLIIGDGEGRIFIEGKNEPIQVAKGPIESIEEYKTPVYTIKVGPVEKEPRSFLYNIENEKRKVFFFDVLNNGEFVEIDDKKIKLYKYSISQNDFDEKILGNLDGDFYKKIDPDYNDESKYESKIVLSDNSIILINHQKFNNKNQNYINLKKSTLWDCETNTFNSIEGIEFSNTGMVLIKHFIFKSINTIILEVKGSAQLQFFSKESNQFNGLTKVSGSWGITAINELPDGSIIYACDSSPSGIHFFSMKGEEIHENIDLIPQSESVIDFYELRDGRWLLELSNNKLIFMEPNLLKATGSGYAMEKLELEIKNAPNNLENYKQLGGLYIEGHQKQKAKQIYLAGADMAKKQGDEYQKNRFRGKIRKLEKEEETNEDNNNNNSLLPTNKKIKLSVNENKEPKYFEKDILFIGEGNFSFTKAYVEKHKSKDLGVAKKIIATDKYQPVEGKWEETWDKIEKLMGEGVTVLYGIDAENIDTTFKNQRFKRIQWNMPFAEGGVQMQISFDRVIPNFFSAASKLQVVGDCIHVTLNQPKSDEDSYWKKRQTQNPIVAAATHSGYKLIRKRILDTNRYPDYEHVTTKKNQRFFDDGDGREFIFEKVGINFYDYTVLQKLEQAGKKIEVFEKKARILKSQSEKKYHVKTDVGPNENLSPNSYYFECSTDEDTSDEEDTI